MLKRIRAWLERVPIEDPAERRQAVTVQVVCFLAIAWALSSLFARAQRGFLPGHAYDAAILGLGVVPVLGATVALLRSGRYRAGVRTGVGGMTIGVGLFLVPGLEYGSPRLVLVALPLVAAALLLGRRALWVVFLGSIAALSIAALRDAGHLGGPGPTTPAPVPLGRFVQGTLTFLGLAIVLDRFGGLLRDALGSALRREAELKASEERFRLAFATSPDAMNLVRVSDGVYVEVNDAFTRLTGYSAREMVGRTSAEMGLWVDRAQRASLVERLAAGEAVHDVEADFRRKGGGVVTGLFSAREMTIAGTRYLLGVTRDITERKRAEQEREALHEQLRHAQKMEAVGRLAGGVAHDFNNVLTSILASAQLLEETLPPDHPSRPDVQQIESDARRAAELTRQLLSFARKQDVAPQVIRIDDRARSLEKMLRRVMGAGIAVETAFATDGWPVFVDPGQVEQVILNLAVNARDAMSAGGQLTISTENVTVRTPPTRSGDPPPGDYVRLSVADTGVGMTPEVLSHAFEPFFTTKGDHGTGLGLATCFSIVAQAGGTIAVESAPGSGTRFQIYLPRAAASAGTPSAPKAIDIHGSETILVVEDESIVRRLAVRSLVQLGYEVLDAGSVSEAQAKVSRHEGRIDCLVMDVELPDGVGRDAAARILAGRPGAPVLLVSGSPDALGTERGAGDPAVQFMPKPYAPIDLARRVRVLLDRAQPSQSA